MNSQSKRITLILFGIFLSLVSKAQTGSYSADLKELTLILERTTSYKSQIKGEKLKQYTILYNRLASDTIVSTRRFDYFYNLAQLLFPLRDNHLGFNEVTNFDNFKSKESIDRFVTTKEFLDYPTIEINIDSLKSELADKPEDSIEGIYYYDNFYSVGVFKKNDKEYLGVVLNSEISLWTIGQLAIHLTEYTPGSFKAIYGHSRFKYLMLQANEKYRNQSLLNSYFYGSYSQSTYSKARRDKDFINISPIGKNFELKHINDTIQYLLIKSFQVDEGTRKESSIFFDSLKNNLTKPNLIFDLRNNIGGAEKESKKYCRLLKKYTRKGHLYVLLNNETISQAEIFTLQLSKLKNVTTVGQPTKGMLSYGSNYGRTYKLPSGKISIYPTDMKGGPKRILKYEDNGITPSVLLNEEADWIEQVVKIIVKK